MSFQCLVKLDALNPEICRHRRLIMLLCHLVRFNKCYPIKVTQLFHKSYHKLVKAVELKKVTFFKITQKMFSDICCKNCQKDLSKIAPSGHTDSKFQHNILTLYHVHETLNLNLILNFSSLGDIRHIILSLWHTSVTLFLSFPVCRDIIST